MKRRVMAWLLVVVMVLQMLPIEVLADGDGWSTAVSNEARGAEYVDVTFQYPVYGEDENGAEIINGYETIVKQMVEKGKTAVEPNIPDVAGHEFTGWIDSETNTPLDVAAPLEKDTVFTAGYSRLGIHTVTIDYVFDIDGSMAQEPYVAEFETGSKVELAIETPKMNGFVVSEKDEVVEVNFDSIEEDYEYEVRYTGAPTFYTIKYHFQNVADNGYTENGFDRTAIHGHQITGDLEHETIGWVKVGPYEIETYPEGAPSAGQPVIAGGMTEVLDHEIEGFVQQEITQRRVMPGGTTVVDVYYDRAVNMYTIDNDGGTAVDSQALRYGTPLGLPDASTMERPGYTFDGFYSKDYAFVDGQWVETDKWVEHDSTCTMPPYDFTIEVRWTPKEEADYKVVYWVQSVNDAYNTRDEDKTYDFLTSNTFSGATGDTPRIYDVLPQDHRLDDTFYGLNTQRSEIGNVEGWGGNRYATATKEIASDGSTVINVYFDRETVTFEFGHYEGRQNRTWVVDYERIGLYGQSWREAGYGTEGWPGGRWNDESGHGDGNWTYLDGFNHEDLTERSVRFTESRSSGRKDIYQYIEALDSTPDNRKWIEADHYEHGENNFNLSSKFLPGFTLYGYNVDRDDLTNIRQAESDTSIRYDDRLNVFSTRNSFELEYANCAEGSMKGAKASYKYEEVLVEPEIVPERPESVESDHEFAGWYLDEACQVPVNWGTYTMPAANLVVYAKWAPPTYTVTYHDIRKNTVNDTTAETKKEFEVEKFGTLVGREDVSAFNQQYRVNTTKYVDKTDHLTYTFMGWYLDDSYTVVWDHDIAITGDRDVYAKWEPSGKVYYRYVFQGMKPDGTSEELGKWPETPFDETVWPERPYGTFALASEDFGDAGLTDFPEFEGWRPMSTLATTRERLTEQYQEIPVYYVPTTTWPLTIHYVDENGDPIMVGDTIVEDELHDLTEAIKVYEYKHIDGYKLTSAPQLTASKDMERGDDGRVHITFTYKKIAPLSYKVEYYLENLEGGYDLNAEATFVHEAEEYNLLLGETAELKPADRKTFEGYVRNESHPDTVERVILRSEEDQNVLKLYYDLQEYTVTYRYVNEKPESAPEVYPQETYRYGETVTVKALPTAPGYIFRGWYNLSGGPVSGEFTMPAADVILQGNWAADTDTDYQVHFYFMQEDGSYPTDPYEETRAGITDTTVSVTDGDKADKTIGGLLYRLDEEQNNVLEGEIAGDGSLVLKLYFKRVMADYTVHHYLKDTTIEVAGNQTIRAQVGSSVTASAAGERNDGFANARPVSAVPQNATITVTENEAQNVITLYYDMPLTLRANSASRTYNGTPLTESGFTVVNPENLAGLSVEDITLRMMGSSTITNPGRVANTIDRSSIRFKGETVPSYYTLTLQPGTLEVLSRLNVTKNITASGPVLDGESGEALEVPAFRFTLLKDGQPVADAKYSVNGNSGVTGADGSFRLNAGETAAFDGLSAGTYTVEEAYIGAWLPEDGGFAKTATIANSGAGDANVTFTNKRNALDSITLQKQWVDGEGTAANRPEELQMTLTGTADGEVVYTAPVTLTAEESWTKTVTGLPKMAGDKYIAYALTEDQVPEGYDATSDGTTVTNTVTPSNLTIQGKKTWVDGGRPHNNAEHITLELQRRVNGGAWSNFNPGADNFKWEGNNYTFTNLPAYDTRGYAYDYRVVETVHVSSSFTYTTVYTDAEGNENDGVAAFDSDTDTATVNITNTIVDRNDRYVHGFKKWVDGGKSHNNAEELTITLERKSNKEGSSWEPVPEGYNFGWVKNDPSHYGFDNLERYDAEGYRYIYRVRETINDPEAAALYETTYSTANGETSLGGVWRVDITNTLIDPEDVSVSGTKTWVDGGKEHDNAAEITLSLFRTSAKPEAKAEPVEGAVPEWNGATYTFNGLERYDAEGYAYTYTVTEAAIEGYTSAQNGNNFTNTLIDPMNVTVSGTKTWVDGGRDHENADEITLNLFRASAKPEAKAEPVEAEAVWEENTYTFSGLDRYDAEGYEYIYTVTEGPIDGYTSEQAGNNFTNTLIDPADVTVSGTKTWVDGGKDHENADEITLNLFRTSAQPDAEAEPVEAEAVWEGNTYTFSGLDRYDAEGYAYTYTVTEAAIEGYTSAQNGYDFTNTIKQEKLTIQGTKTWSDGNDKHTAEQVALTLMRQANGGEWETVAAEPQWKKWTYTYVDLPKYNDAGYTYTYKVQETTKPDGYDVSYAPAGGAAEFDGNTAVVDITNTVKTQEVTVTKQWIDTFENVENYWNLRPDEVKVTLAGMVDGKPVEDISYDVVVGKDSWSAAQKVRTHDTKGNPITYEVSEGAVAGYTFIAEQSTEKITPANDETEVQVTNSLELLGGDGELTVTKKWDDKGGNESDRPEVSFKLLHADGTPVMANGQEVTAELGEDNTALFAHVPANADGYIVEEVIDDATNTGKYVCEQTDNRVAVAAGEKTAEFTNTRTMAVVTVTKKIVDKTTDSEAGLSQKFTFSVDGGKTKSDAVGNGENVTFEVEIGKEYSLSEYAQDGSELSENVWSTEGLGSFTATEAAYTIDVTNTRAMKNGSGEIVVNKIWHNGDGEALAEELTPKSIDVQLYEGEKADTTLGEARTLNAENSWTTTYSKLPAAAVDGTEKIYSVKELAGGTPYGDGEELMIGELKFTAEITETNDGFEIINTLADSEPEMPEKEADKESQKDVQVGDLVTYTIRRTSHLSTMANAIVTDTMPNELSFVRTDSVKVNGEEVAYEIKQEANKITWYIKDVPPMGEVECVLTTQVTAKAEGTIENEATVGLEDDGQIDFEETESTIKVARFLLDKEAQLPEGKTVAASGDTIHYTITVTGTGAAVLTGLTVEDAMFARAEEGSILRNGRKVPADQVENNVITLHMPLREGMEQTIEYDVTVTEDDILRGMIDNLATGRAKDPAGEDEPELVVRDETHTPTEKKNGHLTVVKTTDSEPANGTGYALGETISYKINVINDGTLTIRNIKVTDSLSDAEGQVIGTIESLKPGENKEFSFEYVVTEADILKGSVKNVATAAGESPDPDKPEPPVEPGETEDKTEDKNGHLTVTKTTTSQPEKETGYALGEKISYKITVTNDGNLTITDIKVTDSLSDAKDQVIGTIESLKPGESKDFTFEYVVTEADILKGSVKNVATAAGESPDPDKPEVPVEPGEKEDKTEDKNGHLTVTKKTTSQPENGTAYQTGEKIIYSIAATNDGNLTLTDIVVVDELTGDEWKIASLAPGEAKAFTAEYVVKEEDSLKGSVRNVAVAAGKSPDEENPEPTIVPGETEDPVITADASLFIDKKAERKKGGYKVGDTISYTITVVNNGNVTIRDVKVEDELTGDLWEIASIAPGEEKVFEAEYVVTDRDLREGSVINEATISGTDPEGGNVDGGDVAEVPVIEGEPEETESETETEEQKPKQSEETPETGDTTNLFGWLLVLAASGGILAGGIARKSRRRKIK